MINKKIFPILLFILLLSSLTYGDLTDNIKFYYTFDDSDLNSGNPIDITGNGINGTNNGATTGISGIINQAFDLDGSSDYTEVISDGIGNFNVQTFSISGWFKRDNQVDGALWSYDHTAHTPPYYAQHMRFEGNVLKFFWNDNGNFVGADGLRSNITITDINWHHFVIVYTAGRQEMFIDNVLVNHDTQSDNIIYYNQEVWIGQANFGAFFNGKTDEYAFWSGVALNSSNVAELYNNGTGLQYPFGVVGNNSFHYVSIEDKWGNLSLENVNVSLNNSISNLTDSLGIARFGNLSGNFIYNATLNNYFPVYGVALENQTVNNIMFQTQVNITFKFSSGDLVVTPINLTALDIGQFFNVTGGSQILFPNEGLINFSARCDSEIFAPFNFTLNLTAFDNTTFIMVVNETQNVITFLDENSSNPINDANVIVNFPSGFTLNLTTNTTGDISFSYIQNDSLDFGNYSYYFSKIGYINITLQDFINESNIPHTRTYNLSRAKLNIYIYDRITRELLNGTNVSVAFIGLFNETTNTGVIIKDNLTIVGGDYLIYAGADGYKTSIKSLTFTNQEEFTLNFYLLNLSTPNAGTLFVSTKDSFFRDITGAKVTLLEYIPSSLSYVNVDECVSNVNAECSFAVELNTKVYYIRATSVIDNKVFIAETSINGEIFTVNNDIRNLIFFTRDEFTISTSTNLIYSPTETFINNVSSISVDFFTSDGTAKEVCVEYFILNGSTWISVTGDTYCLFSSNAIQNINVDVTLNRNNTYQARIYVKENFDNILQTYDYPNINSVGSIFNDDFKATIIMIFWIVALALSLHQKNITLFFFLAILISWIEVILFPFYTMVGISVFKTIVSLISIYMARKKQDFQ